MKWVSMKRNSLVCLVVLVLSVFCAWAQTGTSSIAGTITDPQGRAVPAARVTLTNVATNAKRNVLSTNTGSYIFDLITPGDYRIEIEAKGFNRTVLDNVQALIGKQTDNNVQLSLGAMSQVVEVSISAQSVLINTQDAPLGNVFESNQITQLPLEGRNVSDLLSLQPGATQEGYVTGSRADQSNITLDGVDINNAQTGNAALAGNSGPIIGNLSSSIIDGPVLRINSEAVEEFRVTTANGNANQGRSSGAQINIVTKSGSNSWHGAASEFYRSKGFEANNWFNNHATPTVPREALQRNTYEGAVGGAIVKNKLFFFYDY